MPGAYPSSVVIEVTIAGVWTDISSRVVGSISAVIGMHDDKHQNRLASPGQVTFIINNFDGAYTPSATFRMGAEVRITVTYNSQSKIKFYGRIEEMEPDVGTVGSRQVKVTAMDWLQHASDQVIRNREIATNRRIGDAVTELLSDVKIQPITTLIDGGDSVFPLTFIDVQKNTKIYSELNDLALSEWGYIYMDQGGLRLRVEANGARKGIDNLQKLPLTNDGSKLLKADGTYLLKADGFKLLLNQVTEASYVGTFQDLDVVHGRHVLNDVSMTVHPRTVASALQVLWELEYPVFVPGWDEVSVTGYYRDPDAGGGDAAGINQVDPVATTDYLAYELEDGTGVNYTANLTILPTHGAHSTRYFIINAGPPCYLTWMRQRGFGIYSHNEVEIYEVNESSQELFGPKTFSVNQPYQQSTLIASSEVPKLLDIERNPRNVAVRAYFQGNTSEVHLASFMHVDIGSLIYLENIQPPIASYFYVNGIRWTLAVDGEVNFSWILKQAVQSSPIAINFPASFDSDAGVLFGNLSNIASLTEITLSTWVYLRTHGANAPFLSFWGYPGGTARTGWYWFLFATGQMNFRYEFTTTPGIWSSTDNVFTALLGQWANIAVTYDNSNITNDPIMYVNGTSVAITETSTPVGTRKIPLNTQIIMGNILQFNENMPYRLNGYEKDTRIYNRILTAAEIAEVAANENNYDTVKDGMLFQAAFARDTRLAEYIGLPITPTMGILDRIYQVVGTARYNTTSASPILGADPSLASY